MKPGRPRTKPAPLLAEIDGHALATETCQKVAAHLGRLTDFLTGDAVPLALSPPHHRGLHCAIVRLTTYAQGQIAQDVAPALLRTCGAIFESALAPCGLSGLEERADIDTPIGLVLLAAIGRMRLAGGFVVGVKMLAALAGVTPRAVRMTRKIRPFDPRMKPWIYRAKDARRWLTERGVRGLGGTA